MRDQNDKYNVRTVERCFEILDLAARIDEPLSVQTVCDELKMNPNMAFRLLNTMVSTGYLQKNEKRSQYYLSFKVLQLSRKVLLSLEIRRMAMPYLEMLRQKYPKASVIMAVLCKDEVIVVDRLDNQNLPRTYFTPGNTLPFHATSLGKILTCELGEDELDALIKKKELRSYTPTTITDPEKLKEILETVRKEQTARDRSEFLQNDNCNAVPVRDGTGSIIAAISITAFENYMSVEEIEEATKDLRETAHSISYFMGFNH